MNAEALKEAWLNGMKSRKLKNAFVMEPLKKDAINMIANLPNGADIEEIMVTALSVLEIFAVDRKTPKGNTMFVEKVLLNI